MTTPPPSPSYYRPDVPRRDEVALAKPTADSEGLRANRRRLTLTLDASPAAPPAFLLLLKLLLRRLLLGQWVLLLLEFLLPRLLLRDVVPLLLELLLLQVLL